MAPLRYLDGTWRRDSRGNAAPLGTLPLSLAPVSYLSHTYERLIADAPLFYSFNGFPRPYTLT